MPTVAEKIAANAYRSTLPYATGKAPDSVALRDRLKADRRRLVAEFRTDLEAETKMTGHPKAQKVWDMAWERGHSSDLSDVEFYYVELAELVLE